MTIAQTNILWKVEVHKIHIKEWAENKERILGMVPWDDKRKQQPEINWTDYHQQGGDFAEHHTNLPRYEPAFMEIVKPYLGLFLQESDYKFCDITRCWLQRYAKHNFHAPHDHGPRGYACVFYAEMDPTVHGSTEFLQPSPSIDGGKGIESIQVVEGDLILFPCNLFHQSPPHFSEKYRTVIAFNLY